MSQTVDEQLSALFDGELPAEQYEIMLRRLDRDPDLRVRFARYSLIGGVLTDGDVPSGAMQIADRVRDRLNAEQAQSTARQPGPAVASGLFGAGLAAAAAVLVFLNLGPSGDGAPTTQLAGVAPVVAAPGNPARQVDLRANVAPERMTRYLVTHSRYSNAAARQFVDSHVVMPAFRRATWPTSGPAR